MDKARWCLWYPASPNVSPRFWQNVSNIRSRPPIPLPPVPFDRCRSVSEFCMRLNRSVQQTGGSASCNGGKAVRDQEKYPPALPAPCVCMATRHRTSERFLSENPPHARTRMEQSYGHQPHKTRLLSSLMSHRSCLTHLISTSFPTRVSKLISSISWARRMRPLGASSPLPLAPRIWRAGLASWMTFSAAR